MNIPTRVIPNEEKIICIVGGLVPEAGTLLHRFILEETSYHKKIERDQDHLFVYHISVSPWVTDRTNYLLGKHNENSAKGACQIIEILNTISISLNMKCVAGVPCNTFHATPIFNEFIKLIEKRRIKNVDIINMVEETKKFIEQNFDNVSRIGLMSTTGTREHRVYHALMEPFGFSVFEVDAEVQEDLHNSIYNSDWGIKAVSPITEKAKNNFKCYAKQLKEKGAEVIILGCTEIPIALPGKNFEGIPLIDPMRVLARTLVERAVG